MTANFNNFFDYLKGQAEERQIAKGDWMIRSGLSRTRYCEFEKACSDGSKGRDISGRYFLKLVKGLGMSETRIQQRSGIRFTKEQKRELAFISFVKGNENWLRKLFQDPQLLDTCKIITDMATK